MFITLMPPTISETVATQPSSNVSVPEAALRAEQRRGWVANDEVVVAPTIHVVTLLEDPFDVATHGRHAITVRDFDK